MGSHPSKEKVCHKSQTSIRGLLEPDERSQRTVNAKEERVKSPFLNFISQKLLQDHGDYARQLNLNKSESTDKRSLPHDQTSNVIGESGNVLNTEETNPDGRSDYYDADTNDELNVSSEQIGNTKLPVFDILTVYDDVKQRKQTGHIPLGCEGTKASDSFRMTSNQHTPSSADTKRSSSSRMTSTQHTLGSVSPDYEDARASDHFKMISNSKDNDGNMSSDLERGHVIEEKKSDKSSPKRKKKKIYTPYTEKDAQLKKDQILTLAKELMSAIVSTSVKMEDGKISSEFKDVLMQFSQIHVKIRLLRKKKAAVADVKNLKLEIGNEMHNMKVMDTLCDFIITITVEENFKASSGQLLLFLILLNCSDATPIVCEDICQFPGFMEMIVERLAALIQPCMDTTLKKNGLKILEYMLSLVYNIASVDSNISRLRSLSFTQVLLPYLEVPQSKFRLGAIASLADIVDEEDCALLRTNCKIISFLLSRLSKALRSPIHKELGWSAEELCRTVGRLTRNDANKRLLVEEGCLPLLTELALSEDPDEEKEAFQALWMLSFDHNNKDSIMAEPDLLNIIISKYEACVVPETKKLLQGILWTLRDKLAETEDYKNIGENICGKKKAEKSAKKPKKPKKVASVSMVTGHVMISYQWANQKDLMHIRDILKENRFDVWMDIDNMGGSTLQAMAEAIEDASVILLCMSSKYKNSPNCRAEAEYAFQKRKQIIPLMMEAGYQPDGWLGMILGSKLYHDFSGKYPFELKMDGLLKELMQLTSNKTPVDAVDVIEKQKKPDVYRPARSPDTPTANVVSVKTWSNRQVKAWLLKNNIKSERLQSLTGKEVVFLKNVRQEAPEFFYQTLKTDLGLKTLSSIVDFTDLLESLAPQR